MPALIGHSQGISGGRRGQTISGASLIAAHNGMELGTEKINLQFNLQ